MGEDHGSTRRVFLVTKYIKGEFRSVLSEDSSRHLLVDAIANVKGRRGFRLYGYCVLPDRVSLILSLGGGLDAAHVLGRVSRAFATRMRLINELAGRRFRSDCLVRELTSSFEVKRELVNLHRLPGRCGYAERASRAPYSSESAYRKQLSDRLVDLYETQSGRGPWVAVSGAGSTV